MSAPPTAEGKYDKPCGMCGATPTRTYMIGPCCVKHTPAALAGRPENRPDPERTIEGIRRAAAGA